MNVPSRRRRASARGRSKPVLIAIALILFAAGLYIGVELAKPPPRPDFGAAQAGDDSTPKPPTSEPPTVAEPTPATESSTKDREPIEPAVPIQRQPPTAAANGAPRIALVIDDLGRSLKDLDTLANLGVPLTYSVLPFESHTPQVVAELSRRGAEFLCHLPMEAKGGANPGPGALMLGMSEGELTNATRRALAAVPGAVGANNHMGSGLLSQSEPVKAVLSVLAAHRLFFLDSRTSADTVGYSLARQLGLRAGERQVFLDTQQDTAFIQGQFEALRASATRRGSAIAIAHPYRETLAVLATAVPAARAAGFEFVTASTLIAD